MSKITIIEPNSSDKDQVRNYMVSGLPGISPTFEIEKEDGVATITITDVNGTHEVELEDGFSPTVTASKSNKVTTVTMTDIDGTRTATINDGVDLTGGVPTGGVIEFDGTTIPDGYEAIPDDGGKILKAYSLYENLQGANGNITLSDSVSNYDYIEIFYRNNSNNYQSVKVYDIENDNAAYVSLCMVGGINTSTSNAWIVSKNVKVSGTSITTYACMEWSVKTASFDATDKIYITKVLGYKEV